MSTKINQTTAKIYEFPRRFLAPGLRRIDGKALGPLCSDRVMIEAGGSWYHEAAIRDADPSRKP